jgi:hypothetical protein
MRLSIMALVLPRKKSRALSGSGSMKRGLTPSSSTFTPHPPESLDHGTTAAMECRSCQEMKVSRKARRVETAPGKQPRLRPTSWNAVCKPAGYVPALTASASAAGRPASITARATASRRRPPAPSPPARCRPARPAIPCTSPASRRPWAGPPSPRSRRARRRRS